MHRQKNTTTGRRFFFTRRISFPPLDKRNTRDKAKGKAYHFGEVYRGAGVRYLSTINSGQDSRQQSHEAVLQGVVEVI